MQDALSEAKRRLRALRNEGRTWDHIARELSAATGEAISAAAVWKLANGQSKSPRILRALGLNQKPFQRTAEFATRDRMLAFDALLEELGVSLTELCNLVMDGEIELTRTCRTQDANRTRSPAP